MPWGGTCGSEVTLPRYLVVPVFRLLASPVEAPFLTTVGGCIIACLAMLAGTRQLVARTVWYGMDMCSIRHLPDRGGGPTDAETVPNIL